MSIDLSRIKVRGPAEMLAAVPHFLGFPPENSLVVVAVGGPHGRVRCTFRYDLPDPADEDGATLIAEHAVKICQRNQWTTAIVVGYGPATLVTPLTDVVRYVLPRAGIRLHDVLRVDDGRYWSYLCTDLTCCPAEGCPAPGPGHPVAMALTRAGQPLSPSRDAIAASVAPYQDKRAVTEAARTASLTARRQAASDGEDTARARARMLVQDAITAYRSGQAITDLAQLARLTVALTDIEIRDDAWARMRPKFRADHTRLWTDVTRYAAPGFAAAPASLLAFTAWQAGDGCLASFALDRAQADDPAYPMARLLRDAVSQGLPPTAAVPALTPEEVAERYEKPRRS